MLAGFQLIRSDRLSVMQDIGGADVEGMATAGSEAYQEFESALLLRPHPLPDRTPLTASPSECTAILLGQLSRGAVRVQLLRWRRRLHQGNRALAVAALLGKAPHSLPWPLFGRGVLKRGPL